MRGSSSTRTPFARAQFGKKATQQAGALGLKNTRQQFDPVIEAGIAGEVIERAGRSPLRVITAKDDGGDAGKYDSPHAHRAGFKGDIQNGIKEPPGTKFPGGFSYGDQLGVPRRILPRFTYVMATGDDSAALYDNAPDRHFILGLCLARFGNRPPHPLFVAAGWGGVMWGTGE